MAQADADESGGSETRLTSKEKTELTKLRRDKRRLEMENEILKRAAAYFARENVLPN
jgi:transposase